MSAKRILGDRHGVLAHAASLLGPLSPGSRTVPHIRRYPTVVAVRVRSRRSPQNLSTPQPVRRFLDFEPLMSPLLLLSESIISAHGESTQSFSEQETKKLHSLLYDTGAGGLRRPDRKRFEPSLGQW